MSAAATTTKISSSDNDPAWTKDAEIFEYGAAANPMLAPVPVLVHPPEFHQSGPTRVIPFDISRYMEIESSPDGATSPNLMASFIRIVVGESIKTQANATSQAFYVIRGSGETTSSEHGNVKWNTGDMVVLPVTPGAVTHTCKDAEGFGGAAIYWIHDQPLMDYLGVMPSG